QTSVSVVVVGEPQSRPARPPMTTKRTSWSRSVRSAATGLYGIGLSHPAGREEAVHRRGLVGEGGKPLGWREPEQLADAAPIDALTGPGERLDRLAARPEQAAEGVDSRHLGAGLDPGDRRL